MSVRERAVRMRAVLPLCTYVLGYCFGSLLLIEHDLAAWNSTLRRTVLPRCPGTPCHTPGTIRHAPGAPCRTPGTPCHAPGAHASVNLDGFRCSRGMATRSGGVASRSEDGAVRSRGMAARSGGVASRVGTVRAVPDPGGPFPEHGSGRPRPAPGPSAPRSAAALGRLREDAQPLAAPRAVCKRPVRSALLLRNG